MKNSKSPTETYSMVAVVKVRSVGDQPGSKSQDTILLWSPKVPKRYENSYDIYRMLRHES